ncbi:MAG: hypothetical protein WAL71_13955 [Terriglobales bacterium]|jgi:hypothetical protein
MQLAPQALIPALIVVLLLLVFLMWAKIKGRLGNFSVGIGNALFQLHTFVRPTALHIVETKKQRKKENKHGDDDPPDLPL